MRVAFEIRGLKEMNANLFALATASPEDLGMARSLYKAAEGIMLRSKQIVPVDTGTLKNSGTVAPPVKSRHGVTVTMGYGGAARKYALKVHENPRAGRTGGRSPRGAVYTRYARSGQWKFLEQPFVAGQTAVIRDLARDTAKGIVRRIGKV